MYKQRGLKDKQKWKVKKVKEGCRKRCKKVIIYDGFLKLYI